jgi:ABC-type transport system involved in multi-copper enzyme maturation permease subunit
MTSPLRTFRLASLEALKLRRQRLAKVVIAVPAAVAALVPQGLWFSAEGGFEGHLAFATSLELAFLPACLLILLQASLSIAGERSDRTLRDALVAPVGRAEILLSRWIVLALECLLVVAVVAIAAGVSTLTRFSFEDIREEAIEPLFTSSEVWEETIRATLGVALPLVALATLGLLVSVCSASPAMAAALSLGSLMALDVAKSVFAAREGFTMALFNSYLPTLFDRTSYLRGVTAMAGGMGDVLWIQGSPRYALQFVVPAATIAALLGVTLVRFSREEFRE